MMQENSQKNTKKISCWIVTEGLKGTENQCLGVAKALGVTPEIKQIKLRQPWKTFSPYLGFECAATFSPKLEGPWPDLLIASGRKSIAASRYIKKQSGGKTFTVQIQDPRISPKHFDLVAVPAHDPTRGENVIVTTAAPNMISQDILEKGRTDFADFGKLPSPRVAVLIGGSSKAYTMSRTVTERLAQNLLRINASLMITTSRRTGEENTEILQTALAKENTVFWDGTSPNPYFGYLGWADYILVTADSASMLSEACTTGKPAYVIPMDGGHPRIDKLHQNLRELGSLRVFNGELEDWQPMPINDAQAVAQEIRKRMRL